MLTLPQGSKVTVAQVLRRFAQNIHHAAHLGTTAAIPYRHAYDDALRRAREDDKRRLIERLAR